MYKYLFKTRLLVKQFYNRNDGAHKLDHADQVYGNMQKLIILDNVEIDPKLVILSAYFHDIKVYKSRKYHEILAADFMKKNRYLFDVSDSDFQLVVTSILEHRSRVENRTSMLSHLLSSGDSLPISNINNIITRMYNYQKTYMGDNDIDKIIKNIYRHLMDKFSSNGYKKYDSLMRKYFDHDIHRLQKICDNITDQEIKTIILNK